MCKDYPDKCRFVERVRLLMSAQGYADDLDQCRACRWLSAYAEYNKEEKDAR